MEKLFDPVAFGKAVNEHRISYAHTCECVRCDGVMGVREASKQIGISQATLSRVERGAPPSIEVFARLCKWMGAISDGWLNQESANAN